MIVIAICVGCILMYLDNLLFTNPRILYLHIQFHIVIIEIAPDTHDVTPFLHMILSCVCCNFYKHLLHCIIIDHSTRMAVSVYFFDGNSLEQKKQRQFVAF